MRSNVRQCWAQIGRTFRGLRGRGRRVSSFITSAAFKLPVVFGARRREFDGTKIWRPKLLVKAETLPVRQIINRDDDDDGDDNCADDNNKSLRFLSRRLQVLAF